MKIIQVLTLVAPILSLGLLTAAVADSQANTGASFNEVRSVIGEVPNDLSSDQARKELSVYTAGRLPKYKVEITNFFMGNTNVLARDAVRTTTENFDYYDRLEKRLHPNGICFAGAWSITEKSPYTGYFSQGSEALVIARASVALDTTERGDKRGFGLAVKVFPTKDPNEVVPTANFFVVDVLTGTNADHYTDVAMSNEPSLGFTWQWKLIKTIADALTTADSNPMFRPLYQVSEAGLADKNSARTPKWIMLKPDVRTRRVDEADFRRELDIRNNPDGLVYNIFVSDVSKDTSKMNGWSRLGQIKLTTSKVSYGCDRRLHFAHPKMK